MALASSAMRTGASRLFAASSVFARTSETEDGFGGCSPAPPACVWLPVEFGVAFDEYERVPRVTLSCSCRAAISLFLFFCSSSMSCLPHSDSATLLARAAGDLQAGCGVWDRRPRRARCWKVAAVVFEGADRCVRNSSIPDCVHAFVAASITENRQVCYKVHRGLVAEVLVCCMDANDGV
jgi:hypothetical protein